LALGADLLALQEVSTTTLPDVPNACWRGARPTKSAAVVGSADLRVRELPIANDTPTSVMPVIVEGRVVCSVVSVYPHKRPSYVEHLKDGLQSVRALLPAGPVVLVGDFNASVTFDKGGRRSNFRPLVDHLANDWGLVSAYHEFFRVEHGREEHPTLYHTRRQDRGYHIDYVFVPKEWAGRISRVEVPAYDQWTTSDHRPVVVDLDV
jgi:endonuclease/exonuclease/phosphatase family metal-dependent hydrolase